MYEPQIGDFVVTVSLNRGKITKIVGDVLHIKTREYNTDEFRTYYAATSAVIKVTRDGTQWAVRRKRMTNELLPMSNSLGEKEYDYYRCNQKTPGFLQRPDTSRDTFERTEKSYA